MTNIPINLGLMLIPILLLSSISHSSAASEVNLALVAHSSTSYVSGHETINALNDGISPSHSDDKSCGAYGNWPKSGIQWVQYDWDQPISTHKIEVYWFDDRRGVRLPKACHLKYWDGSQFMDINHPKGMGLEANTFNASTFDEITTTRLRLEMESNGTFSTGILEWRVYDSGKSPNFAPSVQAGVDRVTVLPGKTYLKGAIKDDGKAIQSPKVHWSKASGPGKVLFENPASITTTATFSKPGDYALKLTADDGQLQASSILHVIVQKATTEPHLQPIDTRHYQIDSPLWGQRFKALIKNWIPHCYAAISEENLKEGGIQNFIEAGNKLAGRSFKPHVGAVFANAWVHNTVEAMCIALMIDPQGDQELIDAQKAMRDKLEDWIPKILSAQEPDGYLDTCYTLGNLPRWSDKADHEGYVAGYFIESAMAHYLMTDEKDPRMYNAARKLADCWCRNIGPAPKKYWYEGHQEIEQALVRFARFVEEREGAGTGRKYVELAKYLLDSRKGGEEYDQSHLPVIQQYEAVGHAVRAVYSYSGMADVAMETGDQDYQSAIESIWGNLIHRKYYVTGGVGSGETSEGFGKDYSLPNHSYCESCAGCGELFFQYKMNLIHHDAKYADLYEETIYNAILGSLDLEGRNFTYTNPLDSDHARYGWHVCPCCIGNIPRTLLMLPTWMYVKNTNNIYVNLYAGSTVTVPHVSGTDVQMVQKTDYPWQGKVSLTINPKASSQFTIHLRVPRHDVSQLYRNTPTDIGFLSLSVNGKPIKPVIEKGYAVITRKWAAGDRIEFEAPLRVQRVKSVPEITGNRGLVALRYGPLIYNLESVDQNLSAILDPVAPLRTEWNEGLLGGVLCIKGEFTDGTVMTAIPNYARNNRGGRSIVWFKDK